MLISRVFLNVVERKVFASALLGLKLVSSTHDQVIITHVTALKKIRLAKTWTWKSQSRLKYSMFVNAGQYLGTL